MTDTKMLIGSLSSDLYRVASLIGRGSNTGASRFFIEAQKWSLQLSNVEAKKHVKNIIEDINSDTQLDHTLEQAEKFLMYSVLLQNYSLHID